MKKILPLFEPLYLDASNKLKLKILKQFFFTQNSKELILLKFECIVSEQLNKLIILINPHQLIFKHLENGHGNFIENIKSLTEPQIPNFTKNNKFNT